MGGITSKRASANRSRQMTYVLPKLKVRITIQSDSNKRLHSGRREQALKEALDMDQALERRLRVLKSEDRLSKSMATRVEQANLVCACGNSPRAKGFRRSPKRHPKTKEWWYICNQCNLAAPESWFTTESGFRKK